jgi:hypothetical protein
MRVGLRAKATDLDMSSQCPEGAGMSSFFGTRAARNVTRVFWGKAASETMFVAAHTDEPMRISPGGAKRHESIGESR